MKMTEFMRQMEAPTTPQIGLTNQKLKATPAQKRYTLVTITRSSKNNHWQPRKATVKSQTSPKPEPKQRTCIKAISIKELEAIKYRNTHLRQACASKSFIPDHNLTESVLVNFLDVKIGKTPKQFQNVLIGMWT